MASKRMVMTDRILMGKLLDMHNTNISFQRAVERIINSGESPGCKQLEIEKALRHVKILLEDHAKIAETKLTHINHMSFDDEE